MYVGNFLAAIQFFTWILIILSPDMIKYRTSSSNLRPLVPRKRHVSKSRALNKLNEAVTACESPNQGEF